MKVPVLVHRWFLNGGAGWSCHPDLEVHILGCQAALTRHLNGDFGPIEPIEVTGVARVLVGLRMKDPDRETDERNRRVNVLCAAVLPGFPIGEAAQEIRELLKTISLPTQQGMSPQLELDWAGSLTRLASPSSVVKAPTAVVKTQSPYRFLWMSAAAMMFLIILVVLFFVGRSMPPPPEITKHVPPPPEKALGKTNPPDITKPDNALVLSGMKDEINIAREMARLIVFLKNNGQAILDFESADKAQIRDTLINRCRYLKGLHAVRFGEAYFQRASLVDADVDEAKSRIEVMKNAVDVFGNAKELEKFQNEEWEFIEEALYGRVQWCWKALEKEFHKEDDRKKAWREVLGQFKKKEWHKARKEFVESYNGYSADRKYDNAKREIVNKMNAWLNYLQQPNDYVFDITLPGTGEWNITQSNEWTSDWNLVKQSGKFVLTAKKIVAASKPTPIMLFPVWLSFTNNAKGSDQALLYWRIGDNQTEIAGFQGVSPKEKVVVVLRSSNAAVWPTFANEIKTP